MKYERYLCSLLTLLSMTSLSFAQLLVPPGTVLPVRLLTTLDPNVKPGTQIFARLMQDVRLAGGTIPARSQVAGEVFIVAPGRVDFQFTSIHAKTGVIPIVASLRALASPQAVADAQLPETGPDRGTPPSSWTTDQIGGEIAYRGWSLVADGEDIGKVRSDGAVLAPLRSSSRGCSASASNVPQALWVFSSSACGVYGYTGLTIGPAGTRSSAGQITLQFSGRLNLRSGSGLLLETTVR